MASYQDQERLLWEQLSGLVTDAAWLESYAAAAMLKVKETMQVRQGLPAHTRFSPNTPRGARRAPWNGSRPHHY